MMIWKREIAESISQEIQHEKKRNSRVSMWFKLKKKIHIYTFASVSDDYIKTFIRSILIFLALRRHYLINFVKLNREERKSLKKLRNQLSLARNS